MALKWTKTSSEASTTPSRATGGPVRCQQVGVWVVDVKTGQQVGTQFKVDADANGALVKNLPMDLGEHPALESPCERRTAVRSWRRPSAASPRCKAEDAPDRTSQLLSAGLLLAAGEFLISACAGVPTRSRAPHQRPVARESPEATARLREDRYPGGVSSAHQVGVAELRADLGRPAGHAGRVPLVLWLALAWPATRWELP
jgi:hypothetical protein